MKKIGLLGVLVFAIIIYSSSCVVPTFSVRYNDLDSVVRIVNPDHNCGCDYKDKSSKFYYSNNGKRNLYYWKTVYIKNPSEANLFQKAQKTRSELIKLVPELNNYRRFYIEFQEPTVNKIDTVFRFNIVGVAYFLSGRCNGYKPAITAKELIKKSHNKKYEASLCKK
jgi:hypothetical protein